MFAGAIILLFVFLLELHLQVVELDFLYPSEGIHRRWDAGYRITSTAATTDQSAIVLSIPRRKPADETQETLRTSAFPSTHVKVGTLHTLYVCKFIDFIVQHISYIFGQYSVGEMGKKSVYCVHLLWSNCFMRRHVFVKDINWNPCALGTH